MISAGGVVIVGDGASSTGGRLATSAGLPVNTVEVVQIKITEIAAIIPVKAVSDSFADKFSGNKERILAKIPPQKPGVSLLPGAGSVSSFSTAPSKAPIVPRRSLIICAFQKGCI
jgi:hypothetical protein